MGNYMWHAKKEQELKLVTIGYDEDNDNDGFKECGLHYSKCYITGTLNMKRKTFEEGIRGHCLLLPLECGQDGFNQGYGIIFDDWDEIGERGEKELPELCRLIFGTKG